MPPDDASTQSVTVRAVPIELRQFVKFAGLSDTGGAAKQAIGAGRVLVNGTVETRKARQLQAGDRVTLGDQTRIVHLAGRPA